MLVKAGRQEGLSEKGGIGTNSSQQAEFAAAHGDAIVNESSIMLTSVWYARKVSLRAV